MCFSYDYVHVCVLGFMLLLSMSFPKLCANGMLILAFLYAITCRNRDVYGVCDVDELSENSWPNVTTKNAHNNVQNIQRIT